MAVTDMMDDIAAVQRRRRLYSLGLVGIAVAVMALGYGQASSMNSGSFLGGIVQFFDYPGGIVAEAWEGGLIAFLGLMWGFMPALIE
ncbi:MAG: phosphonate ABC transporter, permease protein PhnE, partial [Pseudomonadota bacterium]